MCAALFLLTGNMPRMIGQIIRRGHSTSLIRIYAGRDSESLCRVIPPLPSPLTEAGALDEGRDFGGSRSNCR